MPLALVLSAATLAAADDASMGPANLRCGSYCLYISLNALDYEVPSHESLEERLGQPSRLGYSMQQLAEAARSYGAYAEGVETTLDNLQNRPGRFVCIALLNPGHFVNVYEIADGKVLILDPPNKRAVAADAFRSLWSGKALLVSNTPIPPEASINRSRALRRGIAYGLAAITGVLVVVWGGRHVVRTRR